LRCLILEYCECPAMLFSSAQGVIQGLGSIRNDGSLSRAYRGFFLVIFTLADSLAEALELPLTGSAVE
jgi:hypothetical protein